jgi:hypothetical protein
MDHPPERPNFIEQELRSPEENREIAEFPFLINDKLEQGRMDAHPDEDPFWGMSEMEEYFKTLNDPKLQSEFRDAKTME